MNLRKVVKAIIYASVLTPIVGNEPDWSSRAADFLAVISYNSSALMGGLSSK